MMIAFACPLTIWMGDERTCCTCAPFNHQINYIIIVKYLYNIAAHQHIFKFKRAYRPPIRCISIENVGHSDIRQHSRWSDLFFWPVCWPSTGPLNRVKPAWASRSVLVLAIVRWKTPEWFSILTGTVAEIHTTAIL